MELTEERCRALQPHDNAVLLRKMIVDCLQETVSSRRAAKVLLWAWAAIL